MAEAAAGRAADATSPAPPVPPVLFVFLDGVGLGSDDPEINPLAASRLPGLRSLLGGAPTASLPERGEPVLFRALDATLGHEGLPQSATGQTTLLTGVNAADVMRGHYGPWPGPTLKEVLADHTLFHLAPGGAVLANAYPDRYFRSVGTRRFRPSAPVVAAQAAGVRLRTVADYEEGAAVAADLTGAYFAEVAPGATVLEAGVAGARLRRLAAGHAFTFFDVWLTDRLGHERARDAALKLLEDLDAFLMGVLDDLGDVTLVLTSDHGNLEDLSTKSHTRNPVPLLVAGQGAEAFAEVSRIEQVAQAVRSVWGSD